MATGVMVGQTIVQIPRLARLQRFQLVAKVSDEIRAALSIRGAHEARDGGHELQGQRFCRLLHRRRFC